jgi:hypothetical protein
MWNARAAADGGPDTAHLARVGLERRPRYALRPTGTSCLVWAIPATTQSHIKTPATKES